jgi:hypothetical protein
LRAPIIPLQHSALDGRLAAARAHAVTMKAFNLDAGTAEKNLSESVHNPTTLLYNVADFKRIMTDSGNMFTIYYIRII